MVLWTPTHVQTLLPAIIAMLVIAVVLRLTIGKKDRKIRMIPFQIFACVLVLLEIGKQGLSLYRGYDLYNLPFHFCSILIFMPAIMSFYRGKHEKTISCITTAVLAAVFILTAVYPDLIYSAQAVREFTTNFFSFHTVAFHNLAMLLFLLIPALDLHEPAPKGEPKKVLLFILGFCVISASMAHLLQTNFNNFYRHIALDWGTGLRLDLSFVLLRLDLGIKLYDPSTNDWKGPKTMLRKGNYALQFGVGYPF